MWTLKSQTETGKTLHRICIQCLEYLNLNPFRFVMFLSCILLLPFKPIIILLFLCHDLLAWHISESLWSRHYIESFLSIILRTLFPAVTGESLRRRRGCWVCLGWRGIPTLLLCSEQTWTRMPASSSGSSANRVTSPSFFKTMWQSPLVQRCQTFQPWGNSILNSKIDSSTCSGNWITF